MSQSREKPKLVALPPPAHQAMHDITFKQSVPEYTAEDRRQWREEKMKECIRADLFFVSITSIGKDESPFSKQTKS